MGEDGEAPPLAIEAPLAPVCGEVRVTASPAGRRTSSRRGTSLQEEEPLQVTASVKPEFDGLRKTCIECHSPAQIFCRDCPQVFCYACDRTLHVNGLSFLRKHNRVPLAGIETVAGTSTIIGEEKKPSEKIPEKALLGFPSCGESHTTPVIRLAKADDLEPLFPDVPVSKGYYSISLSFDHDGEHRIVMLKDIYWESPRAARVMLPRFDSLVGEAPKGHTTQLIITLAELGSEDTEPLKWSYTCIHTGTDGGPDSTKNGSDGEGVGGIKQEMELDMYKEDAQDEGE